LDVQHVPSDVDFRIMMTFLEFYEVLLKFVMFKLYNQMDMAYPPVRPPALPSALVDMMIQ
jgi:pescadillo protein